MSTSDKIQSILEMLFTWGMEGIDEKDTQPKDIFTAFGLEAWNIGETYVRRNIIGDKISRYVPQDEQGANNAFPNSAIRSGVNFRAVRAASTVESNVDNGSFSMMRFKSVIFSLNAMTATRKACSCSGSTFGNLRVLSSSNKGSMDFSQTKSCGCQFSVTVVVE